MVHKVVGLLGVCIRGGGSCKNFMRMKESSGIERLMFLMNITRLILILILNQYKVGGILFQYLTNSS